MDMDTDAAATVTAVADAAAVHSSRLSVAYLYDRFSLADVTRPFPSMLVSGGRSNLLDTGDGRLRHVSTPLVRLATR